MEKRLDKNAKGGFTYYIITEGQRGLSKMLVHDYGGGEGGKGGLVL